MILEVPSKPSHSVISEIIEDIKIEPLILEHFNLKRLNAQKCIEAFLLAYSTP